ncbi:hypothetical protein BJ546DRAFT_310082 [Cryomyces antarcticus]|uniref:DUF4604 domain-containing protein n=1 Tax=Cryomyces antarcticus TaxID=329879 RepID=A0ABR0KRT9_9PEZI|nr:hypothetical protein LTR39_003792 [Cryomyces antarcticus]KAK5013631.1 hypothetical protein LTR60_003766 [Cryomyces antarcticus]KAK5120908.1 hypothetical protein LTR16_004445 [Cryomyces antarcticus]
MSFKAKNLEYDANEPAFLRKLRAQHAGNDGRHERPLPRPKRAKNEDEDDGPTYVDESNDTLSKAEYDALVSGGDAKVDSLKGGREGGEESEEAPKAASDANGKGERNEGEEGPVASKQRVTEVGGVRKKRKAVKIIGQGDDEQEKGALDAEKVTKRPKKKTKAINLSFGDEGEP